MKLNEILQKITGYENLDLYDNKSYLDMWEEWYRGKSKSFHNYRVYTGRKFIPLERFTLGMAKKVCEDWANLLVNEKTDIVLDEDTAQETFNSVLDKCKFWQKANEGIEKTFALGGGAWVVSVDDMTVTEDGMTKQDGILNVTFVNAKKMYPITIKNGEIIECAFVSSSTDGVVISAHLLNEQGNYEIHNISATGKDGNYTYNAEDDYYIFDTKSNIPWFVYLKPNIANNIDINSPLGISIFANSIDTLKEIDLVFDSYQNEFALGRKRLFISAKQASLDMKTGEQVETFDSNDVLIYVLPETDDGNPFYQDSTQQLRVNEHQEALQNQLNLLSYQCGFGTEHYKFNAGSVATATQIISENSEMFRNIRKQEILINDALIGITKAIIYAVNNFTNDNIKEPKNIEIKFDDSIIEDKQSEKSADRLDVSMGVMSKAEFRAKWFNEDEKTAQQKIDEISSSTIEE